MNKQKYNLQTLTGLKSEVFTTQIRTQLVEKINENNFPSTYVRYIFPHYATIDELVQFTKNNFNITQEQKEFIAPWNIHPMQTANLLNKSEKDSFSNFTIRKEINLLFENSISANSINSLCPFMHSDAENDKLQKKLESYRQEIEKLYKKKPQNNLSEDRQIFFINQFSNSKLNNFIFDSNSQNLLRCIDICYSVYIKVSNHFVGNMNPFKNVLFGNDRNQTKLHDEIRKTTRKLLEKSNELER